jgi:hypothetical protein
MFVADPIDKPALYKEMSDWLTSFAALFGARIAMSLPPVRGSWFQRKLFSLKKALSASKIATSTAVMIDGQVAKHGYLPQADAAKVVAEAEKNRAEAEKLRAEALKLRAEANLIQQQAQTIVADRLIRLSEVLKPVNNGAVIVFDHWVIAKTFDDELAVHLRDSDVGRIGESPELLESPMQMATFLKTILPKPRNSSDDNK